MIHALFQIAGDIKAKIYKRLNISVDLNSIGVRIRKAIVTFILVDFAWIFFVCDSLNHAIGLIKQMFTAFQVSGIYTLGLDRGNWFFLNFGISILFAVDIMHENNISVFKIINKQEVWLRLVLYMGLIWTIIMFGIYGVTYDTSTFIYFQF